MFYGDNGLPLVDDQVVIVRKMHVADDHTVDAIAKVVGVSRAAVYRALSPA